MWSDPLTHAQQNTSAWTFSGASSCCDEAWITSWAASPSDEPQWLLQKRRADGRQGLAAGEPFTRSPAVWESCAALRQGACLSLPGCRTEQSTTWGGRGAPFLSDWLRAALDLPIRGH